MYYKVHRPVWLHLGEKARRDRRIILYSGKKKKKSYDKLFKQRLKNHTCVSDVEYIKAWYINLFYSVANENVIMCDFFFVCDYCLENTAHFFIIIKQMWLHPT